MAQFQVECEDTKIDKDQSQYGKFIISPLERGQGTTIGNSLRRVLLSNLEGTAVTAIRIAGVNHEFATVPGVREDILDIMLNMKGVVFRSYTSQPQIGRLVAHGPARLTASYFDLPSEIELINPDHPIATLSSGSTLEMEFRVERGRGYRAIDRSNDEAAALDFLQIDAVFMPVRKVNYTVEDARVGGSMEKDRLIMEIWTNGSLTPQEALSQAANILVDLFNPLRDISFEPTEDIDDGTENPNSQIPIEELQLSVRAYNCLKRAQINTVADLLVYTYEDLLEIKNFGQKSAEEVTEALRSRLGITLPQEKPAKG
ncbi:MAG: DNA-directed RNA polymerase subunit alpha [Cyanobacteria bacterium]|nr:DNA-directed RNA polymerase subunit alpha [Cyanobacteriota bacterium]MDW8203034.1 DNA-directed RNA polymerase subunit alpha [Cyanobacteriota bacterium SKYGB_h_bin112]